MGHFKQFLHEKIRGVPLKHNLKKKIFENFKTLYLYFSREKIKTFFL